MLFLFPILSSKKGQNSDCPLNLLYEIGIVFLDTDRQITRINYPVNWKLHIPEWLKRRVNKVDNMNFFFWEKLFFQLTVVEIVNKQANSTGQVVGFNRKRVGFAF